MSKRGQDEKGSEPVKRHKAAAGAAAAAAAVESGVREDDGALEEKVSLYLPLPSNTDCRFLMFRTVPILCLLSC